MRHCGNLFDTQAHAGKHSGDIVKVAAKQVENPKNQ